ncbi:MAG: RNA polymerase factor sigma-54 [Gammaproteobacteria bacterium]
MSSKMLVTMRQDLRLTMSQQLHQAITLLQYNTLELKQLVKQYLETNPLIEVDEPDSDAKENEENYAEEENDDLISYQYSSSFNQSRQFNGNDNTLENIAIHKNLRSHLLEQTLLCGFDSFQQTLAEAIIDAIDDKGYLTMSLQEIQQTFTEMPKMPVLENILKIIQTFDPAGVAARDIRECLLIQLDGYQLKDAVWELAYKIINEWFATMMSVNTRQMLKKLSITEEEYSSAMLLIKTLNLNPGSLFSQNTDLNIEPELYVKKIKNTWQVFLSDSILTNVKVNSQYQDLIRQHKNHRSYPSLKQELEEAQNLLKGLKRRNETLFNVASYIIEIQKDFLDHGPGFLKPMNMADVAAALNLHESTVSRITTGKYIATPRGVFELKFFFPSHVATQDGRTCSATAVKAFIKDIISHETGKHIYSDNEIVDMLLAKGIKIARRTVAKYREEMHILSSYQRQLFSHSQTPQEVET